MNVFDKAAVIGNRPNTVRQPGPWHSNWWLAAIVFFLSGALVTNVVADVLFQDGFEEQPVVLDCEKFNYPCSLAEADADALIRADALLGELWNIRKGGTLDDCHDHLLNQPDVVLIFRGDTSLIFQVDGMMPVVFHEIPDAPAEVSNPDIAGASINDAGNAPSARKRQGPARFGPKPERIHKTQMVRGSSPGPTNIIGKSSGKSKLPDDARLMRVVGEDTDLNGIIDQYDAKAAVLLSPFEWLPSVNWGTDELAAFMNGITAYQGNVLALSNLTETDDNVHAGIWADLSPADVLIISTFAGRGKASMGDQDRYWSWISTGIPVPELDGVAGSVFHGMTIGVHFSQSEELDPIIARRVTIINADYFKLPGSEQRDKQQLMVFPYGKLHSEFGDSFRHVSRYHALSIIDIYSNDENRNTFVMDMFKGLAQGLTERDATGLILDGTYPGIGVSTYFSDLPGSNNPRIIELPRLMYEGMEAPLGYPLFDTVLGTAGDEENDKLKLTVQFDGVTEETKPEFKVRYRIAQQPVPGSFDLGAAEKVSGYDFRYEDVHVLDLGFPLQPGPVTIEIIVDLPEGGESRYSGLGSLSACHFYAQFSGEVSGAFAGPAGFVLDHEGEYAFFFKSTEFIWALDPLEFPVWQASVDTNMVLLQPPEFIDASAADINLGLHNYIYFPPGGDDYTCDGCGGTILIEAGIEGESVSADIWQNRRIRMTRPPLRSDPPGYKATVDMRVKFVAAEGKLTDGSSSFNECAIEYDR